MNDDDEIIDLDTVDQEIKERHDQLIEENAEMVRHARSRAHKMLRAAEKFEQMASNCREIAALHVLSARQLSEGLADLLSGEFDIEVMEADGDEEEEDEDE